MKALTNVKLVERLIETVRICGGHEPPARASKALQDAKQAVLARMRPEQEIISSAQGEPLVLKTPAFDPNKLPGGVLPDAIMMPDGGGPQRTGHFVQMDGGGTAFQQKVPTDGPDSPSIKKRPSGCLTPKMVQHNPSRL